MAVHRAAETRATSGTSELGIPTREEVDRLRSGTRAEDTCSFAAVEEQIAFVVGTLQESTPGIKLSKYEWALLVHLARAGYIAIDGVVQECEVVAGDLAMLAGRAVEGGFWCRLGVVIGRRGVNTIEAPRLAKRPNCRRLR
jgi:hypothetical protein